MKHKYGTNHSDALFIESIIPRDPIVSLSIPSNRVSRVEKMEGVITTLR